MVTSCPSPTNLEDLQAPGVCISRHLGMQSERDINALLGRSHPSKPYRDSSTDRSAAPPHRIQLPTSMMFTPQPAMIRQVTVPAIEPLAWRWKMRSMLMSSLFS